MFECNLSDARSLGADRVEVLAEKVVLFDEFLGTTLGDNVDDTT